MVTLERRGCAGIITLNRSKALNSLNQEMIDLLQPALKVETMITDCLDELGAKEVLDFSVTGMRE